MGGGAGAAYGQEGSAAGGSGGSPEAPDLGLGVEELGVLLLHGAAEGLVLEPGGGLREGGRDGGSSVKEGS